MPSTATRSRISYVIPPPHNPVPLLQLPPYAIPRQGAIGPLLLSSSKGPQLIHSPSIELHALTTTTKRIRHPRHRLGVVSLALDASTQLAGRSEPEGILYTGGRDGLVCSWDLGIPMKKRELKYYTPQNSRNRWETMTGWGDDGTDEEGEDRMDGDILGDVSSPLLRRRHRMHRAVPYEHAWETDLEVYRAGKPTQFRQCSQTHTDWVNDLLLCNYNQTVVSASSDGSIKAWNPHSAHPSDPFVVGTHGDYIRCLASCREQKWILSGSFDRTIKLWDMTRTNIDAPLLTLHPPSPSAPKSSIYALAADPHGHAIASGSPERVVRIWDPRSGKRTGKLVGHTDNIRAILMSDDARYLLTGSADASIKLWSLSSQRCLHTFTYHTDSVWSLYSTHPSLEIFYSGDKTNLVCKVDVEGCADVSEGECVVLCQEPGERSTSEGINKIVALSDNALWTASGSSSIRRWKVPPRRAERLNMDDTIARTTEFSPVQMTVPKKRVDSRVSVSVSPPTRPESFLTVNSSLDKAEENFLFGIPFKSLVKLASPNDPFTQPYASSSPKSHGQDPEVATLYSAASIMSVPPAAPIVRSPFQQQQQQQRPQHHHALSPSPMRSTIDETMQPSGTTPRAEYEQRELANDAVPLYSVPDDVVHGDHGLVRSVLLNDRLHALTVDISGEVAVWDIVRGVCLGRYPREDVTAASAAGGSDESAERSPREALEVVRERIEGEAVVAHWSSVDTKTGVLTVHLTERCFEAEIYADEAGFGPDRRFNDEMRINIGKWVLRNLFIGFIREEHRVRKSRHHASTSHEGQKIPASIPLSPLSTSPTLQSAHLESNGSALSRHRSSGDIALGKTQGSGMVISSVNMIPAIPPSPVTPTTRSSPILTPLHLLPISKDNIPSPLGGDDTAPMLRHGRPLAASDAKQLTLSLNNTGTVDYHTMRIRGPGTLDESKQDGAIPQTPLSPGGGLMGRLKQFGKVSGKKGPGDVDPASKPVVNINPERKSEDVLSVPPSPQAERSKALQQVLLSGALTPPTSNEAPTISLPPNMMLLLSEEGYPGWKAIYRGSVSTTWSDRHTLEDAMPLWLLEYLLTNKVPAVPIVKISFVLLPWPNDPDPLPEFLNTSQSKLTASRFLRVRKLTNHVQDRLEKMGEGISSPISPGTPRSSLEVKRLSPSTTLDPKAEDLYQIMCNDVVLPLDMTLAAVKQFIWRQSTEVIMYYRRRVPSGEDSVARAL